MASRSAGSGAVNSSRSRARMSEDEAFGVQERPGELRDGAQRMRHAAVDAAVERIADDRVADGAQVHADLMRAPGGNGDAQQRDALQIARPRDARNGVAGAAGARRHLDAVLRIAADRGVDALALLHQSPRQRDVFLLDFAIVELPRQLLVRIVVLGDHHHARRALVEPMHDAGTDFAADAAQVLDVVQQRVDERAGRIAGGGMDDHARGLVDDHDVGVVEQDLERQVFRQRRRRLRLGQLDADDVAFANVGVRLDLLVARVA